MFRFAVIDTVKWQFSSVAYQQELKVEGNNPMMHSKSM